MTDSKKILILGAGFGGVRVALDLSKTSADLTLVNNTSFHTYIPSLYEVANAVMSKNKRVDFKNLASTVNIPLKTIFENKKVKLIEDQVTGIDLTKRQVKLAKQSALEYDYLVIALGSTTSYFGIKGSADYSHPLKNLEDALNIRDDIQELIWQHKESIGNPPFEIVVAGGGFTGVEFAGKLTGVLKKTGNVTILEGSKTVLPGMPAWAEKVALKRLTKLGVKVKLNWLIGEVSQDKITSTTSESLNYDYLVWTTGVRGVALPELTGLEPTKRGQLQVTSLLNTESYPEVFVVGDMAEYFDATHKSYAPPAAWAAISQAETIAKNVKASLSGQSLRPFVLPKSVFVVPIGRMYAVSNWLDLKLIGLIPWMMKHAVSLKYLVSILPLTKAFLIWFKGLRIFVG